MEDKKTEKKEANTYFGERIAHINNIRKSDYSPKKKIEYLVSIADDFQQGDQRGFLLECAGGIYDYQLLCDSMINMAEDRMASNEIVIMDEFHDFVELFKKNTQTQKNLTVGKSELASKCMAIQEIVKDLMSKCTELEEESQQRNYYRECLLKALSKLEQLDKEKRNLEWELADKPKEVEEHVLMNLIEIAKNKPLSSRQGIKSLLQDYITKNNVAIGSSDFLKELADLDNERLEPKMVQNGDNVQNKYVTNEVNNVGTGGVGININKEQ